MADLTATELIERNPALKEALRKSKAAGDVASLLQGFRQKAGLTQKQLAQRLGVSQPRIAQVESVSSGDIASIDFISRYAEACGRSFRLVDREDAAKRENELERTAERARELYRELSKAKARIAELERELEAHAVPTQMTRKPLSDRALIGAVSRAMRSAKPQPHLIIGSDAYMLAEEAATVAGGVVEEILGRKGTASRFAELMADHAKSRAPVIRLMALEEIASGTVVGEVRSSISEAGVAEPSARVYIGGKLEPGPRRRQK